MVAITLILAAVIAAFVFSTAGNIQYRKPVTIDAQKLDADQIAVVYLGGADAGAFDHATVNVTDDGGNYIKVNNLTNAIGNVVIAKSDNNFTGNNRVYVVGYFIDGSVHVLLETRV